MALLSRSWRAVVKQPTGRLPAVPNAGSYGTLGMPSPARHLTEMGAYGSVSWLFAAVSRIAHAVATVRWSLYQTMANGERQELIQHPLLDLWNDVNPFETGESFREAGQQHLDLTGEWWTVLLRGRDGIVAEMQLVRPDRMFVVPDPQTYIRGYIYRLPGAEPVPLGIQDVLLVKLPNPLDPYRGMGPVQALLVDLESERAASEWTRNFFWNSAEPGGVIETDPAFSEADYDRLVKRWKEEHQGVSRAHRVAVLERAHWVTNRITQREMEFDKLRRLNRDLIVQAGFGMPTALLGVSESVNRANAEAAEVMFGRWVVRPRLERIRDMANERLTPLFGAGLVMDFHDPTPDDRDRNIIEATQGYEKGILTLNEARRRLGEGEMPGGEELRPPPAAPSFGFNAGTSPAALKAGDPLLPSVLEAQEILVRRRWSQRLDSEREALANYLAVFFLRTPSHPVEKIELSDVAGYNWDWWAKYGDEVVEELTRLVTLAIGGAFPGMLEPIVQRIAGEYARERGSQLLRLDGDLNLARFTRQRVNELVAQTIEQGQGLGQLQRALRDDVAFSRERARTVARTETATALGQGHKQAAIADGRDEKHWVTQGASDPRVEEVCLANEAQGWILMGELFQGGTDTVPQHPNCLPGHTRVTAHGVTASSQRWYDGDLVILRTASGKELSCTPNHPILTDMGWLAAELLCNGDYVVSSGVGQGMPSCVDDNYNVPSSIEKIAMTFCGPSEMASEPVPTAAKDFHGDGMDGKIAVIRSNRLLWNRANTSGLKHRSQVPFKDTDAQPLSLNGASTLGFLLRRMFATYGRTMSSGGLQTTLTRGHLSPSPLVSVAERTDRTLFSKDAMYRASANMIPDTELLLRLPREVFLDELVEVRRTPFSGHVYNLQTLAGWYIAEGIITHNCMCVVRYRTSGGADIDPSEGIAESVAEAISGARSVDEVRCPGCNSRMPVSHFQGRAAFQCRKCKQLFSYSTVEEGLEIVRKVVERDTEGRIVALTEERPKNGGSNGTRH